MISDVMGLCRICNQKHYLPICGTELKGENLKITVYNTICNSCVEKVDYILVNKLICKEDHLLRLSGRRKIVLVDAATNTENNLNNEIQKTTLNNVPETIIKKSSPNAGKILFCEFCEKKFTHTGDLNKHRRKHTGEQPYDCPLCNRKFSHASNLARHQRLHSGENPFSCPLKCGRSFSRKDKLSNHISKHHCQIK